MKKNELILGEDYYLDEQKRWVFTKEYHLKRGYCCSPKKSSGCLNCPYRTEEETKNLKNN